MNRTRTLLLALSLGLAALVANAASLTLPRDSQASSVSRMIGLVKVTVNYSSPRVHAPNGEDRHGKVWGKLVPYGMTNLGFGTCKDCPWRAGANENTVITVSHDIDVEGQKLAAGSYGLHMIPAENEFTVIFSKNAAAWGSFFYDPADDVLRVKVKPMKSDYQEALSYDFTDSTQDQATLALRWEELQIPIRIAVHDGDALYMAALRNELRAEPGFQWENWVQASQYALKHKHNDEALAWAQASIRRQFIGKENFQTLNALADAQEAAGKVGEAKASREKAINHVTAGPIEIHQYARQLQAMKQTAEAIKVFKYNAERNGDAWPVHVGLMRAYAAEGDLKQALEHAKKAYGQAPDDLNKKNLEAMVKSLEEGKNISQ